MSIKRFFALSMVLSALTLSMNGLTLPAQAGEVHNSRLSQLIKKKPNLYLPSRLLIGTDNKFTLQGPPGSSVILYLSSTFEGMKAPNGVALRVGSDNQQVSGVIPESGVLELVAPIPDEEILVGKNLFVDAILWKDEEYRDMAVFDMVDSTGRRANENYISIAKASSGKGAFVMPNVPGLPAGMMQQLNNLSDMSKNPSPAKKDLIYDGAINRSRGGVEQNPFLNRPTAGFQVPTNF
ncbi:MAG: hypothetical protein K2X66_13170 [Cyanobacteria bacterium]|nr:hypothetical protein [Cyanobacteriota bacterium]